MSTKPGKFHIDTWNGRALGEHLRTYLSADHYEIFDHAVDSVNKRRRICSYHREELSRELHSFLSDDAAPAEVFKTLLTTDDDVEIAREQMFAACSAHALGFMQSAHSVVDLMSLVLHSGLLAKHPNVFSDMKPRSVSMWSIREKLKTANLEENLLKEIRSWRKVDEYKYLQDFTNFSKHRGLVPIVHVSGKSVSDDRTHRLKFKSFTKDAKIHAEKSVVDFIDSFDSVFFSGAIEVGRQLNISLELPAD